MQYEYNYIQVVFLGSGTSERIIKEFSQGHITAVFGPGSNSRRPNYVIKLILALMKRSVAYMQNNQVDHENQLQFHS